MNPMVVVCACGQVEEGLMAAAFAARVRTVIRAPVALSLIAPLAKL